MVNEATIEAYKAMAKDSECPSMETQIRENLERTCDKFAGNEDKFERCISYLEDCASQILDGKSGDVPDEVCFRICRDYFNDEIWKKEDEEEARKKAEAEERARLAAEKKAEAEERARLAAEKKAKDKKGQKAKPRKGQKAKPRKEKPEEEKASKCARCGTEVLELEKGLCPACHALLHPAPEPVEPAPENAEPEKEKFPICRVCGKEFINLFKDGMCVDCYEKKPMDAEKSAPAHAAKIQPEPGQLNFFDLMGV